MKATFQIPDELYREFKSETSSSNGYAKKSKSP
jgi:hypothetical protein